MLLSFIVMLFLISTGMFALVFYSRLRRLRVIAQSNASVVVANRYRPMVRLLADEDTAFIAADKRMLRKFRTERRRIFRSYLDCLTKDYGRLLNGVRLAMVRSGVDRPDLARALAGLSSASGCTRRGSAKWTLQPSWMLWTRCVLRSAS
jgi:hypothetical protein